VNVILLENIRKLGALGDKVKVKAGFGRNFLIPKGKAVYATPDNIKKFEARRSELEKKAAEALKAAEAKQKALLELGTITISAKAGDEGKLFGSIGTRDIAAAITEKGIEIIKSDILLSGGALRQVGEYDIAIELHGEINVTIKVSVVSEGSGL